jgi:hypothetical protein
MSTEAAFAKEEGDGEAICFLGITDLENCNGIGNCDIVEFDRWGWTNKYEAVGGKYHSTLPMYAGAAECLPCKGYHVGNLTIDFSVGVPKVTYGVFGGFFLNEVHLHVGMDEGDNDKDKVPTDKNGLYTVSPGQYGCGTHTVDEDYSIVPASNTETVFVATFDNVPEIFYVIAHAVVAGSSSAWSTHGAICPP